MKGNEVRRLGHQRFGLTLIELLIVIGIIAVLVGIVWVALAPIRERARIAHCINNFKQLHLAIEMYRQDYNGVDAEKGRPMEHWELGLPLIPIALKPYAKSLLYCPLVSPLPKDPWMAGYMWAVWRGKALGDSGPDWAKVIAQRGDEFPISADCNHNPRGCNEIPWIFIIVLRLNGQVETKRIWVFGTSSHEW